jgi:hypothetical protein
MNVVIENLNEKHLPALLAGIETGTIRKPPDYFERCLVESTEHKRVSLIATIENDIAGWGFLLLESKYPHFRENGIS